MSSICENWLRKAGMKRYGNLWNKVCERSNVELAFDNVLKNKKNTSKRRWLVNNRAALVDAIHQSLINESYEFGPLESFVV